MADTQTSQARGGASGAEIARFDGIADEWWDPHGPLAPLHALNPLRVAWIAAHMPVGGRLLDVGCGGGLAAEAMARRGHAVLGIDAAEATVAAGRRHAAGQGLDLEYRQAITGVLVEEGQRFDGVLALEVIEHVPDQAGFVAELAMLLRPGGRVVISTLNRTARSLLVAKFGAEYVARLLPAGTHEWRRFVAPAALGQMAREAGLRLVASGGFSFDAARGRWRVTRDLSINYVAAFEAGLG